MPSIKCNIKLFLILCLLSLCNAIEAQSFKLDLAESYMDLFEYKRAASIYEDVLKKYPTNYDALKHAAVCYNKLRDSYNSERVLMTIDSLKVAQAEDLLLLASAQKTNKKYDDALKTYQKYSTLYPGNELVQAYVNNTDWAYKINRDSSLFALKNSKINSKYSDFAPCYYQSGILFSSARGEDGKRVKEYSWNQQAYLNLFVAELTADSNLVNPVLLENGINTRFHEGTAAFNEVQNILFVTRNNYIKGTKKEDDEGYLNLAIYSAKIMGEEFEDLEPFKYNSEKYSVGHPSISVDGLTIYFASDMPGGSGGTDIYKSLWKDGEWSEPENLGTRINTSADEMFPYVHTSGVLYFSSDGHTGLGGMDIQSVDLNNDNSKVQNAGYPLNSPYDDFSIVFNKDAKGGFFASNRPGGLGDDDIYKFFISTPKFITISGKVIDEEKRTPVEGATIYLQDESSPSKVEIVGTSDENGEYTFTAPYQEIFDLKASKKGYFESEKTVASSPTTSFIDNVDFGLSKYDFLAKGYVLLADDDIPLEGVRVALFDELGTLISEKTTGEDGYYSFGLFKDHVYRITCELQGYALQSASCDTRNRKTTIFEHDFKMFKLEVGVTVKLDNIYYDYAKSDIRPDAALELDKLVTILDENPSMKIELSSHTDARGSAPYNLSLSRKRAKSAVDYIISKGIMPTRIESKGYGESKPLNRCVDGVKCSEEEYQINRRTEFTILDI